MTLTSHSIPAIIITPICPHSLSFRPIVVPAGVTLRIRLSPTSRNTAWYSVDGSENKELLPDYFIQITTSKYPLPSICRSGEVNDWFEGLATCLHWNKRQHQLPLSYLKNQSHDKNASSGDKLWAGAVWQELFRIRAARGDTESVRVLRLQDFLCCGSILIFQD